MRLAPLRQHSAYIHPHGVIHIAGQHVFKTRCVCQGQRYPRRLLQPLISRVLIASLILPTAHADKRPLLLDGKKRIQQMQN